MATLSDLHEQIVAAGVPIDSVKLDGAGTITIVYAGATQQQQTAAQALADTWLLQSPAQRLKSVTTEQLEQQELSLATIKNALDQAILDSAVTITLPGTAAAALPVIQAALNAINNRQNSELRLLKFILNNYRPKTGS